MSARRVEAGARAPKRAASGALGLALASAFAWLCCLPVVTGALGIGAAALAAAFGPLWPLLAGASVVLLGIAAVQTFRGSPLSTAGRCEVRDARPRRWLFLGTIGALTLAFLTFPWWSAEIIYRLIR